MADNLGIITGTDATVATDEVSSVHYQKMKLIDGTADSTTAITATGGRLDTNARPAEVSVTMKHARVALTASQTGTTVLDPTGGTKFVLHKLVVSASATGSVQFFDGTDSGDTVIGPILSLTATGGWSETWDLSAPRRSAAADNILKYTTDSGFAGSVYIEFWEE